MQNLHGPLKNAHLLDETLDHVGIARRIFVSVLVLLGWEKATEKKPWPRFGLTPLPAVSEQERAGRRLGSK